MIRSPGAIAAVLKQPGGSCAVDEVIAQIETDKVTIDVRARRRGRRLRGARQGGGHRATSVRPVCAVDAAAAPARRSERPPEKKAAAEKAAAAEEGPPQPIEVPAMGHAITEGAGGAHAEPGDAAAADEVIAQIETDKVTIDVARRGGPWTGTR